MQIVFYFCGADRLFYARDDQSGKELCFGVTLEECKSKLAKILKGGNQNA